MSRKYTFIYGLMVAGLMIAGYAKPPTMEIAEAENAVNAAAQDGAADFALGERHGRTWGGSGAHAGLRSGAGRDRPARQTRYARSASRRPVRRGVLA